MARHIIWYPHFDRYDQSSIKRLLYGYSECHSLAVVSLKKEVVREQSCEAPCSSTTSVAHKKKTNPLTLKMHFAQFLFTIRLSHMSLNVLIKMTTYLCIWSAFALMLSLLCGWFFFLPLCRAAHIIKGKINHWLLSVFSTFTLTLCVEGKSGVDWSRIIFRTTLHCQVGNTKHFLRFPVWAPFWTSWQQCRWWDDSGWPTARPDMF